jgi:pyrroloquinoline quinone biosynthesis protein E
MSNHSLTTGILETMSRTSGPHGSRRQLRDLPKPRPAAGAEAYLQEREAALAFSAARRANYERYLSSSRQSAKTDYLPIKLDIENVSRCNFRCTMCVVSDWPKGKRARDLTIDEFKRMIDEQYGLVEIKLQGIGEPLMQGAMYFEMIKYARSQRIWVRTTTNASLLHLNENYKKLVDTGVNEIQISIDGADKQTFEAIRRGSRFERVIANCKLINEYCRSKEIERTKMWTLVQRRNIHQLEALVHLAPELGFTNQVFELQLTNWGLDKWSARNGSASVEDEVDQERLQKLVRLGEETGSRVYFWNISEKYSILSRESLCPWPFERAVVTSDLRTVPCCTIGNPDAFEIGSGQRFRELWKSDEYTRFRQAHLDGKIPKICQGCYYKNEHRE